MKVGKLIGMDLVRETGFTTSFKLLMQPGAIFLATADYRVHQAK
jgi:hypothetical protein